METTLLPYQDLRIQLEEIRSATDNFNDEKNYIASGGFGRVYKGEVSHSKGRSMAAVKRLDRTYGQGIPEFLKEITMLSRYRHENLISLLGFCYERDEMILVYEYASHQSLDRHINSSHLTWSRRLKICLDAAKGLCYLHDPQGTHQRLIHCDIKSANILLDDHWNAKVSDFGLSIMGPANEQQSLIVTAAAGTRGYCDPQYAMTHTLTKESDVYSFGVVLFEVLCGTLCCIYKDQRLEKILVPTWTRSYEQKKLNDIIFKHPTIPPIDQSSLKTFSDIAYRCLKESRRDRPVMAEVVAQLKAAVEIQEFSEGKSAPLFYEEMAKSVVPPLNYGSKVELKKLLAKGVLLNSGKTWFSINKKGEHREMISCGECVVPSLIENYPWSSKSKYNSRFAAGTYHSVNGRFKARVRSQFLSPLITYTVNLVFKFMLPENGKKCHRISLKHKLQGETKASTSYLAYERADGWWMAELYQFTNDKRIVDLEILFNGSDCAFSVIEAEGIEFRPLKVDTEDEKLDKQPVSVSDANWDEKLPTDYEDIIKWSKISMQWTTKNEVYSIFCKGFLINEGQEWFSLDENGKKCHMLSASAACREGYMRRYWSFSPKSRFGEAVEIIHWEFNIASEINYQLVSSQTTYASYLVYTLPEDQSRYEAPVEVMDEESDSDCTWYIYLRCPQTPVIRPKAGQNTHSPLNRPKIKGLPRQRSDGWTEVQIWEFRTAATIHMIPMSLRLAICDTETPSGLIIQGVEFRPL